MIEFWKSLAYTTKFSAIGFVVTAILGLMSMGFLGYGLYYLGSFLFKGYPPLDDWHGDWVWPATIAVGMAWSLGFIFGGIAWYYLSKVTDSIILLRIVYLFLLWFWAVLLWYLTIRSNVESLG